MTNGAPDQFSTLDDKINVKGYFERILKERESTEAQYRERIDERFASRDKELKLQATEYERRLALLNHEHQRIASIQGQSVTQERFEQYAKTEAEKRELALERVNERFEDYLLRYEARQREVDQALAIGKGAAEQAQRIAEEQGRKSNRNIGIAVIVISVVVGIANFLGTF